MINKHVIDSELMEQKRLIECEMDYFDEGIREILKKIEKEDKGKQ